MRDVLCIGMFGANACYTSIRGFAGLGQRIIAAVEILAFLYKLALSNDRRTGHCSYLELVLQKILLVG